MARINSVIERAHALVLRAARHEISREMFETELESLLEGLTVDERREVVEITGKLLAEVK